MSEERRELSELAAEWARQLVAERFPSLRGHCGTLAQGRALYLRSRSSRTITTVSGACCSSRTSLAAGAVAAWTYGLAPDVEGT